MENLKELVIILSKNKLKTVETINNGLPSDSKLMNLYEGVYEKKYTSDEDAIDDMYGDKKHKAAYNKLKARLQTRIINSLFFIDLNKPSFNEYQKAYYNCHKNWASIMILIGRGAKKSAATLAQRTLTTALKYEFTDIVLNIVRLLRNQYAITGLQREYEKYNKLTKKYSKIINAEIKSEEYRVILSEKSVLNPEKYLKKLDKLRKKVNSYNFVFNYYRIKANYAFNTNDYTGAKKHCHEAIEFLKSQPHILNKTYLYASYFQLVACCTQLQEYTEGREAIEQAFELLENQEGTHNWFLLQHSYFILCLHTDEFAAANKIFYTTITHPRFNYINQNLAELWKIGEAYLNYFIKIGKIALEPFENQRKYRLNKFLNEVPTYLKQKRGANVSILVIQVLFLLQQKKYDEVIDRVESLDMYCSRYLRNDEQLRSNCFIKMLLQIPKAHFNKKGVERKVIKYKDKLKTKPFNIARQADDIEIIPYEQLWEYVIGSLNNKFHYLK